MSTISNRFYVAALEDGTTLHGNLTSTKPLSQAWNKASQSAVPNWTTPANQPVIYLTLLSGNTPITKSQVTGTWLYNGAALPAGKFSEVSNFTYTYNGQQYTTHALKIIDNLASDDNLDIDTITFNGSYKETASSTGIPFTATIQIRVSEMTEATSNIGLIYFHNGVKDITESGQTITAYGQLYDASGNPVSAASYTTVWYVNDTQKSEGTYLSHVHAIQVTESEVTDYAVLRCDFTFGGSTYSAYAEIDDMQDPEYLYIQVGPAGTSATGNSASLRAGETVRVTTWVGTRDNAAVSATWSNATHKVQIVKANGTIATESGLGGIPNPDSGDTTNYFRTINTTSSSKHYFDVSYTVVKNLGSNITGVILVTK